MALTCDGNSQEKELSAQVHTCKPSTWEVGAGKQESPETMFQNKHRRINFDRKEMTGVVVHACNRSIQEAQVER